MDSIQNQKSPDKGMVMRLLGYLKPFKIQMLLVLSLIIIATGFDLLRPKIIQIAIDEHIKKSEVFYQVDENEEGAIRLGDYFYLRSDTPKKNPRYLVQTETGFYLSASQASLSSNAIALSEAEIMLFRGDDFKGIIRLAALYLGIIILGFAATYGQVYLLNRTGQTVIYRIRKELFNHLLHQPLRFYDTNPIGNLVTRMTNDTENLNEMFTSVLVSLFRDGFTLIGIIIIMFNMDVRMTLFVLVLTPIIGIGSYIFRKKIRDIYRLERAVLSKINNMLSENIMGMKIIQIYNKEKKVYKEFDEENRAYYNAARREIQLFALFRPGVELVRAFGIALLIYYGGHGYLHGVVTFGVLYAFIDYIQRFFQPILGLTETYNVLQSAMASTERVFALMDVENPIKNTPHAKPMGNFKGKIEFQNVWFAYKDEDWVLKDVSFIIEPGQFAAFVGATGAGKSSIINLISRFYEIQKGYIRIDDVDIKAYDINDLRKHIGVVMQDVFMFTGTIAGNITLGDTSFSYEQIKNVAERVNAANFIEKLPLGYDEPVMERGATLSTGERQLLAFARTLIFNPPMLILDEATANIDTETEMLIQDALEKNISGRTTIAIAHRIATVAKADVIFVMSHGEIVESGTQNELIAKDGLFRVLYDLQYKDDLD